MPDPRYELRVQFARGVDPIRVATQMTEAWRANGRAPLLFFPKGGQGTELTQAELRDRLAFRGGPATLKLKTSRSPSSSDIAEFYFSDPTESLSRPANYCSVHFHHDGIDRGISGYSQSDLARLLKVIVASGHSREGYVESYSVLNDSAIVAARSRIARARGDNNWPVCPHWLVYLSAGAVRMSGGAERLERAGLIVGETMSEGGLILCSPSRSFDSPQEHVQTLLRIINDLGMSEPHY